jgi:hypothetical protein
MFKHPKLICVSAIRPVVLAAVILVKHLKEWRTVRLRPNAYVMMIVRNHIIYFVRKLSFRVLRLVVLKSIYRLARNLTNQILLVVLWADTPLKFKFERASNSYHDLTGASKKFLGALCQFCTVYSRAPSHHQYLGHAWAQ